MSVHGIILAAGFGTRLRPITEWIPKPLMPVGSEPLLGLIAQDMVSAGVTRVAVNTHHLPEAINAYVAEDLSALSISLYHEPEILGTGGPLVNARELLAAADCFVLYNGDILSDINLSALIESHRASGDDVTMALIDGPENKLDVDIDEEGHATVVDILDKLGRGKHGHRRMTYAGISVFSPKIFEFLPEKPEFCSIITAILKLMEDHPRSVGGYIQSKMYWNDLGTIEKFLATNSAISEGRVPIKTTSTADDQNGVIRLAEQGSAREFYRVSVRGESRVLMRSSSEDADFDRFNEFGNFFSEKGLPTPELYGCNPDNHCVLMEYLGDTTLNSWVKACTSDADLEGMYRRVIDELVRYQVTATEGLKERTDLAVRQFDYDYLRWETNYFRENYLQAVRGVSSAVTDELDQELHRLAEEAGAMPYLFLHRDFQSQNIMVMGDQIRFVDFQGGRFGPLTYDVMSLVNDPYVDLAKGMRERLAAYYVSQIVAQTGLAPDTSDEWLCTAGLQRIMQALGAYGFLSLKKGKTLYLDYIPQAERYLMELLSKDDRFPNLQRVMAGE